MTALADLRVGDTARIAGISPAADPAHAARLSALGLEPGEEVSVLSRAPLGDPIIVRVMDCELALRRQQTVLIDCRADAPEHCCDLDCRESGCSVLRNRS